MLACEIRQEGVVAAGRHSGGEVVLAFAALPNGALTSELKTHELKTQELKTPDLKTANLADAGAVRLALESALAQVNARTKAVTVVVPDAAARVLLLDFDTLPAKQQEAMAVVRFRLRKMVPFDVETAAVSYQVMAQRNGQMKVLAAVMPADVVAEYEGAVRDAGYDPGVVLPSTLASAAAMETSGARLMVNATANSVTTAVTQGDEMLLHRSIDLPADTGDEEMARAVITALAWYEDTLHASPQELYYAGAGGAKAAAESRWIGWVDPAPRIRDFALPEQASAITAIPPGLTAGVVGALAAA